MTTRMITVDGLSVEAGSDTHLQAVGRQVATLEQARDAAVKRADAAEGKLSVIEKEHAELKAKMDELGSQEELDSRVSKRLSLIDQARGLLGPKYKWAGKSDAQIMRDALKKAGHAVADDASADFVAGAFAHAVAGANAKRAKDAKAKDPDDEMPEGDLDPEGTGDPEDPEEEMDDGDRQDGGFRVTRVRRRDDGAGGGPIRPPFEEKWRR